MENHCKLFVVFILFWALFSAWFCHSRVKSRNETSVFERARASVFLQLTSWEHLLVLCSNFCARSFLLRCLPSLEYKRTLIDLQTTPGQPLLCRPCGGTVQIVCKILVEFIWRFMNGAKMNMIAESMGATKNP